MIERFEIGEVAIYVRPGSSYFGCEVTVIYGLQVRKWLDSATGGLVTCPCYIFSMGKLDSHGMDMWAARPEHLRKKKPPALDRDCYRVTSWEKCDWFPKELEVVTS